MISWDTKSLAMSYLNSDESFLFPQTRDSVIVLKASMIWDLFEEVASLFDERKEMVFLDGLYLKDSAECSDIFNFKLENFQPENFLQALLQPYYMIIGENPEFRNQRD